MSSTTTNMQQLIQNLANDLCKNFEESIANSSPSTSVCTLSSRHASRATPASLASKLDWIRKLPSMTLQQKPRES